MPRSVTTSIQRGCEALPPDLSLVLQIQALDLQIQALTREIDRLSKHIAAARALLAANRHGLAQTKPALEKKNPRQIERESLKISSLLDLMSRSSKTERFRASQFQHEIRVGKGTINEYGEAISEKMVENVALQEDVSCAEASLASESSNVAEYLRRTEAWIEVDYKERGTAVANRRDLSTEISPTTLCAYERIRKARGIVIGAVALEGCGSSHVRLRPQFPQQLGQAATGIVTRDSSGLIIYRPEGIVDARSATRTDSMTVRHGSTSRAARTWDAGGYESSWDQQGSRDDHDSYDDWNDYDYEVDSGYRDDWDYEE